jgi:hypothetical protein
LSSPSVHKIDFNEYFFAFLGRKMRNDCKAVQQIPKTAVDPDTLREMVAERAYCKAEKRGFAEGHELEDWLEAELEIKNQCFYWFQDME